MLYKFLWFIFCLIDFILVGIFVFFCSFLPKTIIKNFMPRLFRLFCWSFIRFLGRSPHVHEKFNPPLPKQYIVISNHPSGYDLLVLNAMFPVRPLAQHGVRKWLFVGKIAEATGTIFVKRDDKNSRDAAKQAMNDAVMEGSSILIYPEGGCYGKHLTEFKSGAFSISLKTGVPVLPVYLQYEAENSYEWGWDDSLPRHLIKMFTAQNKHTHCYVFEPIYPQNFSDVASYKDFVFQIYSNWEQKFRLAPKTEPPKKKELDTPETVS